MHHASLWNVIERIFGVIKHRFQLMTAAAEYNLKTQAKIPCALAALHNYIRLHDPDDTTSDDLDDLDSDTIPNVSSGGVAADDLGAHISAAEKERASARRDSIVMAMWEDYKRELELRQEL